MRGFVFILAAPLLIGADLSSARKDTDQGENTPETIGLLVKYKNKNGKFSPTPINTRSSGVRSNGGNSLVNQLAASAQDVSSTNRIARVQVPLAEASLAVAELMADDDVEEVEDDYYVFKSPYVKIKSRQILEQPLDGLRNETRSLSESIPYGVQLVQAPQVWAAATGRSYEPVRVCLVDTGYDRTHIDLPDQDVTGTETKYGSPFVDGDGHGTHCAGVIGALGNNNEGVIGVNPEPEKFRFHISKALNEKGIGTASTVVTAIEGCIESGSKIISMSLGGGPKSNIAEHLFQEAYDRGALIFAAAGNHGDGSVDYPASYPHVISVGAVNQKGKAAGFSNENDQVELMGPGVSIFSTYPDDGYFTLSGTSMSTPYVAGVAALVWAYFPECSNHQIRNVLALTAKDIYTSGCDNKSGYGTVQAKAAFDLLDRHGCSAGGVTPEIASDGAKGGCGQANPIPGYSKSSPVTPRPTPMPTKRPTSMPVVKVPAEDDCAYFQLDLSTDSHGIDTRWELDRIEGKNLGVVGSGPPAGYKFADNSRYRKAAYGCLPKGTYEFFIYDDYGDGIASPGFYSVSLNGNILAQNSEFGFEETTRFIIGESGKDNTGWVELLHENFDNGYGDFYRGGHDVVHRQKLYGRDGVVRIQDGSEGQSTFFSREIPLEHDYSRFQLVFSFYSHGMEDGDSFCFDYSDNDGLLWLEALCWESGTDFVNDSWYDEFKTEFATYNSAKSLWIRFRCDAEENNDDVIFDEVRFSGFFE